MNLIDAKNHTQSYYTQLDSTIDFDVGDAALRSSYPSEYFSVQWTGFVKPLYTETYRFYVQAYSTAKFTVSLNSTSIIVNEFTETAISATSEDLPSSSTFTSSDVTMTASSLNPLSLFYAERRGPTKFRLLWESDSQSLQPIPSSQLFSTLNSALGKHQFTVTPAPTNETTTHLVAVGGTVEAVVGVLETHVVEARDVYGNL